MDNITIIQSVLSSDSFVIGIFKLVEDDFIFVMSNKLLADCMGTTVEALAGRGASELGLPSGSIEKWVATLRQCREERKTVSKEFFSSYMGRDTWHEYSLNYIEGSGNLFSCFAVDITERKRIEDALVASEAFLNNVFDSIQDGISVLDRDLNIIQVNHVMEDWYPHGVPFEGKKCFSVYHGRSAQCETCPSRRAIDEKTPQSEIVPFQDQRGAIKGWKEIFAFPLMDKQGVVGVIEHVRDITGRKKADEALFESERTKAILMDGIPESLMLLDRNGIILDANCVLARMLRRSKKELIGAYAYGFLDPETAACRKSKIDEVFSTGQSVVFEDARAGTYFENIITPVLSKEGTVEKVAIIAIDITERKRAEAALRDAKLQAELYLDLLGHDINNMHQIALGYLELARAKHPDPGHQEYLDKPIDVLYRSARLIKNVRKLQKLRDDALGFGIVDLAGVLTEVRREYGEIAGKTITLDLSGSEQCSVRANELLHDVFANLVSNAVNHTGDGTNIAIVLETKEENGDRYYRVSVEDDGPGISDGNKGRIFDRMMKGITRAKGMGLGLYLVKSLVESYGGRVWVEDRIFGDHTRGAKFVVMLPVAGPLVDDRIPVKTS